MDGGRGADLAWFIRARRLSLGLTQRGAAERAGVSLSTWQALERGTVNAASYQDLTLARVATGLNVAMGRVFEAAGRPVPEAPVADAQGQPLVASDTDPRGLLEELQRVLVRLNELSTESFLFVCSQALETADRLIELHEGER